MSKTVTYDELIKMLAGNYKKIEKSIANQILLNVSNHYPTIGSYREAVWKALFEMIVPQKYCIEQSVFIIDSYGHKSKEVDLVIFDEMYTPYIFNYGRIKFIPIEAVAAVVQCKSKDLKPESITEWRKSIESLITSMDSVARMANRMVDNKDESHNKVTQTATRPIMILCAMVSQNIMSKYKDDFDIILSVEKKGKKIMKLIRGEQNSLEQWNDSLNHALDNMDEENLAAEKSERHDKRMDISGVKRENLLQNLKVEHMNKEGILEENVLLSLIFQLNQLLMILNNPMLFPHQAYANCFNNILKELDGRDKDEQR